MKSLITKLKVEKRLKMLLEKVKAGTKASQNSAKQLLRKTTAVAQGVGKATAQLGRRGLKQWPYAILVIILFLAMMPLLQAQIPALSPLVNTLSVAKEAPAAQDQESSAIPYDLFSQQGAHGQLAETGEESLERDTIEVVAPVDPTEHQNKAEEPERPVAKMAWPISGSVLTNFGFGYSEVFGDFRFHRGVHIGGQKGTKVTPAAPGTVLNVGENKRHGQFVQLEHRDGYTTFYGNLDQVAVKAGDKVDASTVLGLIGEPGFESLRNAPSLYFKVSRENQAVDPLEVLEVKK